MLKGVSKGLGIQKKFVYVNIGGHWVLNLTLIYFLTFYFKLRMLGMWLSKLTLEYYLAITYSLVIYFHDWDISVQQC